jgi:hypothetical protein
VAETVVLAVGLATDAGEVMTVYDTLETLTLGRTDDVDERNLVLEDVLDGDDVTEGEFTGEVRRELDELLLGSGTCLFEVPLERLAGVFFGSFVIGKLYSGITIFFNCTQLRDNTRPSFDNGAWNVFSISTENGSHSDFLSN